MQDRGLLVTEELSLVLVLLSRWRFKGFQEGQKIGQVLG